MRSWLMVALVLGLAAVAQACEGHRSTKLQQLRTCFENQRRLVGALEMWNLDLECNVLEHLARGEDPLRFVVKLPKGGLRCTAAHTPAGQKRVEPCAVLLPVSLLRRIQAEGYLTYLLRHEPRLDEGSSYALASFGSGIICLEHGEIHGRVTASARTQLREAGILDRALLARASVADPRARDWRDDACAIFVGIALVLGFLWTTARLLARSERSCPDALGGGLKWAFAWVIAIVPMAIFGMEAVAFSGAAWEAGVIGGAALVGAIRLACMAAGVVSGPSAPVQPRPAPTRRTPRAPLPLAAPGGLNCAVCASSAGPEAWVTCPSCDAAHHAECWSFQDGCAAYGCAMAHGRWRASGRLPAPPPAEKPTVCWIE